METNNTTTTKVFTPVEKVLYTGRTHTTGGRDGVSRSDDGKLDIQLTSPGFPGFGTNPEQLFAAGWSACFIGAMRLAAGQQHMKLPEGSYVDAEVDLGSNANGFQLQARLKVHLPGLDTETAQLLVDSAHKTCPYSKMSRGNIDVNISLV